MLSVADDEDYGNFTDVSNGFDFTINVEQADMNGRTINKVASISPKRKESPLSDDAAQVESWLENQNDIMALQTPFKKDFDKLKSILQNFLNPEAQEQEGQIIAEKASDFDSDVKEEPKSNYSLSTKKSTTSPVEKFDDMFGDDDSDDGLPF